MNKQRGFLNILSVGIVIIMGLLSAALVNMIISSNEASIATQANNRAFDLANAAVEAGLAQLKVSPAVCTGAYQPTQTVTTGEYRYACQKYNGSSTLSNTTLSPTATSLNVANATGFAPFGSVSIGSEIIYYNSISGTTLLGLRRGMQNTTPATHAQNDPVSQNMYVVTGEGGAPSLTNPSGLHTIHQAATVNSNAFLFAGDNRGHIFAYNGSTWSLNATVSPAVQINGISCVASNDCWAVGNSGRFYRYNGSTWTLFLTTVGSNNVNAVSCSTPSNCVAVGNRTTTNSSGAVYTYNGTWSVSNAPTFGSGSAYRGNFLSISCAAANNCWAGNMAGTASQSRIFFIGTPAATHLATRRVTALSCATTSSCQGVSNDRVVFSYDGSWSNIPTPNGSQNNENFTDISCPAANYCVASSTRPRTYVYTGSWASAVSITPPRAINRLSCLAANQCVGGATNGQFYSFDGSGWTEKERPDNRRITAMSQPLPGGGGGGGVTRMDAQF